MNFENHSIQQKLKPKETWNRFELKIVSCKFYQLQLVITYLFEIKILSSTTCQKGYNILYDLCIQGSSSFPLKVGSNSKFVQVSYSIQKWISAAPPTFRDHNSWTIDCMRVCLYFLERSQNYLQPSCWLFSLNLHQFRLIWIIEIIAGSKQNLSQKGKSELKHAPLEIQPNLKRSWGILPFWPIHSCSLVRELALTILRHPTCF
jgi:hypothetical protein